MLQKTEVVDKALTCHCVEVNEKKVMKKGGCLYINHSGMPGICTHTKSQHSLSPKPLHLAPAGVPKSVQGSPRLCSLVQCAPRAKQPESNGQVVGQLLGQVEGQLPANAAAGLGDQPSGLAVHFQPMYGSKYASNRHGLARSRGQVLLGL